MLLIAYVIAGICCCTLSCCFCLCCKKCFGKKVDPNLNSDLTASGYFKKKKKGEDGEEYELESMSDYATGGNDGPSMAKESKKKRD